MISKSNAKFIKSLQLKKYRKTEQAFIVEGAKSVLETLSSDFEVLMIAASSEFLKENPELSRYDNLFESTPKELSSIGTFKTNNSALLVAKMKPNLGFKIDDEYVIALDGINDPGNMGAIIRIADWYGINKIVASEDTVDFYNPKVIAASKGSFNRVRVFYTDLIKYFDAQKVDVFGASMKGQNIHSMSFPNKGIIVMGNEANGISTNLDKSIHYKITIPRFGAAESLNVAMATSIICDNVFRAKS